MQTESIAYPYVYRWERQGRKDQHCRVIARGKLNSCSVMFEDGYTMVTSRNAVRRRKDIPARKDYGAME